MMNLTAYGQICSIHHVDCVHITRDEQRQCIKWFKQIELKDSIIASKDSIIVLQEVFIESSDERITMIDQKLSESRKSLDKMKKKRRNAFIIGGITTILAPIVTLAVIK